MTSPQSPVPPPSPLLEGEAGPRIGSMCSGFGGLDGAVQAVFGGEVAWHAENDPDASRVLAHRYPSVPNLGDLTAVDWAAVEPVDVVCAGFPCQDVSIAGKRAGLKPGTRSGVWLEVFHAIVYLRPRLVVLENVIGLLNGEWDDEPNDRCICGWPNRRRGLYRNSPSQEKRYLHDPHRRWHDGEGEASARHDPSPVRREGGVVPQADGSLGSGLCLEHPRLGGSRVLGADPPVPAFEGRTGGGRVEGRGDQTVVASDSDRASSMDERGSCKVRDSQTPYPRAEPEGAGEQAGPEGWDAVCPSCGWSLGDRPSRPVFRSGLGRVLWDLASIGFYAEWRCVRASDIGSPHRRERWFLVAHAAHLGHERGWPTRDGWPGPAHGGFPTAHAAGQRYRDAGQARGRGIPTAAVSGALVDWGSYKPAVRRWEHAIGRAVPAPTEPGRTGPRLSPRFVEWLMGLPAGWVTDVPGISRNAQLRILGNGVVPQQATAALALLLEDMEVAA